MKTSRPSCPACWRRFFPTARTPASAGCSASPTKTFGSKPAPTDSLSSRRIPTFSSAVCFTAIHPKSSGSASATALVSNSFNSSRHTSRTSVRSTQTHSRRFSSSRSNEAPNHALQRTAPRVTVTAVLARSRLVRSWRCPTSAAHFCAPPSQLPRHAPPSLSLGSLGVATRLV